MQSTILSLIDSAANGDREALERFLQRYLFPLSVWARIRLKLNADRAEELAHEFATKRIIEGDLLRQFDSQRGRFRHFLQRALLNFASDQLGKDLHRQMLMEQAAERGEFAQEVELTNADELADAAWAHSLLDAVVRTMRDDCLAKDQMHLWEVFRGRLWQPLVTGEPPCSFESLAESLALKDPQQARLALWTARKKFNHLCMRLLMEETDDPEQAKKSLDELVELLTLNQPQQDSILRELFLKYEKLADGIESLTASSRQVVALLEEILAVRPSDLPSISAEELVESTVSEFVHDAGLQAHREREVSLPPVERFQTLFDLFVNRDASLPTLQLVKDVARQLCDGSNPAYSRELGLVIYYLCLAAVHVNCGRIAMKQASTLPHDERRRGFAWLAEQDWLPGSLRELAGRANDSTLPST